MVAIVLLLLRLSVIIMSTCDSHLRQETSLLGVLRDERNEISSLKELTVWGDRCMAN